VEGERVEKMFVEGERMEKGHGGGKLTLGGKGLDGGNDPSKKKRNLEPKKRPVQPGKQLLELGSDVSAPGRVWPEKMEKLSNLRFARPEGEECKTRQRNQEWGKKVGDEKRKSKRHHQKGKNSNGKCVQLPTSEGESGRVKNFP